MGFWKLMERNSNFSWLLRGKRWLLRFWWYIYGLAVASAVLHSFIGFIRFVLSFFFTVVLCMWFGCPPGLWYGLMMTPNLMCVLTVTLNAFIASHTVRNPEGATLTDPRIVLGQTQYKESDSSDECCNPSCAKIACWTVSGLVMGGFLLFCIIVQEFPRRK